MKAIAKGATDTAMHLKSSFSTDELFCIMTVLKRLVPFIFAGVLQSLSFIHVGNMDSCDDLVLEDVENAPLSGARRRKTESEDDEIEKEDPNERRPSGGEIAPFSKFWWSFSNYLNPLYLNYFTLRDSTVSWKRYLKKLIATAIVE